MIADEKGVVRRQNIFAKNRKWRFELRRAGGQLDQWPLLRIPHKRTFPIFKGQSDGLRSGGFPFSGSERRNRGEAQEIAPGAIAFPPLLMHCLKVGRTKAQGNAIFATRRLLETQEASR